MCFRLGTGSPQAAQAEVVSLCDPQNDRVYKGFVREFRQKVQEDKYS